MAWPLALRARADEQDDVVVGREVERLPAESAVARAEFPVRDAVRDDGDAAGRIAEALRDLVGDEARVADDCGARRGARKPSPQDRRPAGSSGAWRCGSGRARDERPGDSRATPHARRRPRGKGRRPGRRSRLKMMSCRSRSGMPRDPVRVADRVVRRDGADILERIFALGPFLAIEGEVMALRDEAGGEAQEIAFRAAGGRKTAPQQRDAPPARGK